MLTPFLFIGFLLAGEPAGNEALQGNVTRLVRNLGAETAKERKDAEDALMRLGPAILDLLPAPESQQDEAAAKSLREIIKQLQDTVAAKSVESSTVTMHGRMKVSKALVEIQTQTGNRIIDLPRTAQIAFPDPEIAVEFDKSPFWTALDSVLDQAQLSIYPYDQPGTVQIKPRGPNGLPRSGRADIEGPVRIEPVSVLAKRDLRRSSPPTLQVFLEVAWEPRLHPIAIKQRMADIAILDSSGRRLPVDDPQAEKEAIPPAGSSAVEMDIAMPMPTQPLKEIASLQGTVRAMLLGRVETFRFLNLLQGKQVKRIAAATVTLTDVRKNGDCWEVSVRLHYDDAGDALESHRNWALLNEAYLEDADGKQIPPDSMEPLLRTKTEIGVGYVFAMPELPKKAAFVYKTPGMVLTKEIPYKLREVKLP